ncbi:MAG TPA: ATP-grasp domain-containing protein [Candidatus Hydrogenedentes bacterium]|nr:ATP-grasp domain-containing protein [Candidatus Hydrogenedentota bacterium]HOK90650.1 ATP-grasp domain-containing protein [Candidatus Hydrogenedentota bacterium]HPO29960.1 ATP-grasp domain-containing protein [Candidatus Hydrogenedentota bacterium]
MGDRRITVAVIGVGGNVSQGIVKALRQSPLSPRVVGLDLTPDQAGLYWCDAGWVVPRAEDPAFLPRLAHACRAERVDIILTGCEPVLDALADQRQAVESATGAMFPVPPPALYWRARDKWALLEWLREAGLPTARAVLSEDRDGLESLRNAQGFPLLAKPRRGGGSRGLFLVQDDDDLAYIARKRDYVVEEMLRSVGGEYTVGCFSNRSGDLQEMIVLRRELHLGTTYRAWVDDHPEVRAMVEALCRVLRVPGPCNFQLLMTERGPICFEVNPRFSGSTAIRATLGFNDVDALIRERLLGETPHLPRIRQGVALRYWHEMYPDPARRKALAENGRFGDAVGLDPGTTGPEDAAS